VARSSIDEACVALFELLQAQATFEQLAVQLIALARVAVTRWVVAAPNHDAAHTLFELPDIAGPRIVVAKFPFDERQGVSGHLGGAFFAGHTPAELRYQVG